MSALGRVGEVGGGGPADFPAEVPHCAREGLTRAILEGDVKGLERLLAGVDDVNAVLTAHIDGGVSMGNCEGYSLLQLAAREGQEGCVRVLLDKGARVELPPREKQQRVSALHLASLFGREDCLRLMLERMSFEEQAAVVNHREEMMFWLDDYEPLVKALTPLQAACLKGHAECAQVLLKFGGARVDERDDSGMTALHYAAFRGSETCIDELLRWGAEVDARNNLGKPPLFLAIKNGNVGCVELLLKWNADVTRRVSGVSALDYAATLGADVCVRALLRHGVNPNPKPPWLPPLFYAAQHGHGKSAYALLEAGARKDERSLQKAQSRALQSFIKNWDPSLSLQLLCGRVVCDKGLNVEALPPALSRRVRHLANPECREIPGNAEGRPRAEKNQVFYATRANHPECVQKLVKLNPKSPYEGLSDPIFWMSPMEVAARKGHLECLRILLDESSHPDGDDARRQELDRAFKLAVVNRQYACVPPLFDALGEIPAGDLGEEFLLSEARSSDPRMYELLKSIFERGLVREELEAGK